MVAMPAGPWVLVVGCHRSGTSAVTGALALMGFHGVDPSDRMDDTSSNPEHWESLTGSLLDEDLLASVGGAWDAPPPDDAGTPFPDPLGSRTDPAAILAVAFPEPGPLVWKDPRNCLLLPYWRDMLPGPLTAVFLWREPMAVARSLQKRDGIPLAHGLALWERYNRTAAIGLQGVDTYVLDYASVITDPVDTLGRLASWLRSLPRFDAWSATWDVDRGIASIDAGLRHERSEPDDRSAGVPTEHEGMRAWLATIAGGHEPFAAEPPPAVSVWPEAVLAGRREMARLRSQLDGFQDRIRRMEAELEGVRTHRDRLLESTSWKVTAPLRTVLAKFGRPD